VRNILSRDYSNRTITDNYLGSLAGLTALITPTLTCHSISKCRMEECTPWPSASLPSLTLS
jgi:hypothetical protein